jgi:ankyrin repeat protein
VSLLIAAGAAVNSRVTEDFSTPLHKACAGSKPGHLQCVIRLLSAGADVHALNKWKETPLLTAANHGQAGTVGALLNAGADPCRCTDTGWSPLSIAAYKGHDEVVLLLLEKGAPTEEEDPTLSALLQAATKGLPSTVEILLRHGADHTVTTKKGDTALSILVEQNLIDTAAEMVTEYKASVPRCSRDRKKVQRARLLINLRVKQLQRECSLSLDSDDYSDQDDVDDDSNSALHDSGGSPSSGPVDPKKKKKVFGRTLFEKSIENAEAEAKAAADALLLELEQEDAQAQKDEVAASTKRNKKKKKKERERFIKLEEERLKKEKEQREEEERMKFKKAQEEKERKEREAKEHEQREKELLEEAERLAKAAQKRKEKEDYERKLKRDQEKKDRDKANRIERKVNENGNGKQQNSPRENTLMQVEKKSTSFSKSLSPESDKITSPASKQRILLMEQSKQLFLPKSPDRFNTSTLLPRNNKKILDEHTGNVTSSTMSHVGGAESLNKTDTSTVLRDSVPSTASSLAKDLSTGKILGIEYPAVSLFRREKISELLSNYAQLPSMTLKINPLSLFSGQIIRSIINKWIVRASQSSFPCIDPLIPSWHDSDLLEAFFQRQFISESQRSYLRSSSISMEAARDAGNTLARACVSLAKEVKEYATKIERLYADNLSDVSFSMNAQDFYVNGSKSSLIVIDWSGRSQLFIPLITFNKLRSRFCGPSSLFLSCVYSLLLRYSTRRDIVVGTSLDFRLPAATIEMLSRELNVTCELSSDPLFVHKDNLFFGLFDDIDSLFGGLPGFGSDRDEEYHSAPWKNGISAALVTGNDSHTTAVHLRKILSILEQSEGKEIPLSFAVFIIMDGLRDFEAAASSVVDDINVVRSWLSDKQLKFLRCCEIMHSGQHLYAVGDGDGQYDTSTHNSIFITLQNDMGHQRFSLRANSIQNILSTLLLPKASSLTTNQNVSVPKERISIDTPPSVTPVPSSPSSSYGQGFLIENSLSDAFNGTLGITYTLQHNSMTAVTTPVPSLNSVGARRRERLFKLVDDGDDEVVVDTNSDVVSGMLRNLQNSSMFLREHDNSVHDVDIEAISLMGIVPSPALDLDLDKSRNSSHESRQGMRSSRLSNLNIHPSI